MKTATIPHWCLTLGTLLFSCKAIAAIAWLEHDLKLNDIGVGIASKNKQVFVSLGKGFDKPTTFNVRFSYKYANQYHFHVNGQKVNIGTRLRLTGIHYGAERRISRYLKGQYQDTYTLVFTNLPVIQLQAAKIIDTPASPGSLRLMGGQFNQDTNKLSMAIQFHGSQDSQQYDKKSFGVEIRNPNNWQQDKDIKLLDLNKDNDWILDSVYVDTSYCRDSVSHDIFRAIRSGAYVDSQGKAHGQAAPRDRFTEVILNGAYHGVFTLNEKPDRSMYDLQKITVPVDANGKPLWQKTDFSNPQNGSALYKANLFEEVFFDGSSAQKIFSQVYPKPKDISRWQPLLDLSRFIANSSDAEFIAGIGKRIDLNSVVDWWALVLASRAEDNIRKNFILAKSGAGKFFLQSWDHDGSFGVQWFEFEPHVNNLIKRLTQLPATGFNNKLKVRWRQLRKTELSQAKIMTRFKTCQQHIVKGRANIRNEQRWEVDPQDAYFGSTLYINRYLNMWLPKADKMVANLPSK
jgi:CotH kinase protein